MCTTDPVRRRWKILVRMVQKTFGDRTPPEELAWATMILISKWKGEFEGIGIVEVAWKVCTAVVNCWLNQRVVLHNALNGFRAGWGTGMAILEAKLDQQLAGLAHNLLFQVFLDIHKFYDSLDRGQLLEVLKGYWMGPNMTQLLTSY